MLSVTHALAALALVSVPFAPPAVASGEAYCEVGTVAGTMDYDLLTPVTASSQSNRLWTMKVDATCKGTGGAEGHYVFTIRGSSHESCTEGGGYGQFVTGTRNGAAVDPTPIANISYGRGVGVNANGQTVVHYFGYPPHGSGQFYVSGTAYTWYLWFDYIGPCPNNGGAMVIPHMAVFK